ncbi:aminoglycoside phosphotransferase [Motilibacter rhizosphaerae]|uniref:Aminoglycoside phosphotransferase n=1 Tax=Motilibacter rhizosphaerae TaxID=598652 RepID=A0A4V2F2U7_9ACTN|nr:phosphotransferase [Motilibacter rhizosphaerae]RZS80134.1 aminoglycoside phosphotransferase [Motilibacter rhizosphaerae]
MSAPDPAPAQEVEVVAASADRATVRCGSTFVKIDSDRARAEAEVAAMRLAPVPTPQVLWHEPPVLALAAVRGTPLGRVGHPSTASARAWTAAGAAVRRLHDAPLPPRTGPSAEDLARRLAAECDWLRAEAALPYDLLARRRRQAESVLRPWEPVFVHGDLHVSHVFVDGDEVTGILDWSEAGQGDALQDIATLTLSQEQHLDDLLSGYGRDVDLDVVRGWWAYRCLTAIRWLSENGYGDPASLPEAELLRRMD